LKHGQPGLVANNKSEGDGSGLFFDPWSLHEEADGKTSLLPSGSYNQQEIK